MGVNRGAGISAGKADGAGRNSGKQLAIACRAPIRSALGCRRSSYPRPCVKREEICAHTQQSTGVSYGDFSALSSEHRERRVSAYICEHYRQRCYVTMALWTSCFAECGQLIGLAGRFQRHDHAHLAGAFDHRVMHVARHHALLTSSDAARRSVMFSPMVAIASAMRSPP